ncbi:Small ribosomal subunit biogenesis GTPase RsgA 1, mitochondrial [Vitis vinifera]|uniref:Small ribosomal subunit biogenesis GTPase RsgA 1, mitochondrial n=1 Tax=Vitis vinifera TaxID=29760 RepID=A0A438CMN4_VITVI|nr:Small ribosomal subunit biogenesis GTPase RsgA 1, mitochondrial [Vitis vinifera]
MPIASTSIFRYSNPSSLLLLRRGAAASFRHLSFVAKHQNPISRKPQNKNLLRAKQTVKHLSSLSPTLPVNHRPLLSATEAVGMVAAAQANFMRVIVEDSRVEDGGGDGDGDGDAVRVGVELLCVVRAVLKKIKRRVLVGDKVLVGSIDWVDRRGVIENVFSRKSEILDPPVANVDHLLVLFAMEQPKLEVYSLTRFLVEAESTGIPITLALNKSELVDEETRVAWKSRLRSWGYGPVFCSVESKFGLDTLAFSLREQTTVIVGPSGVGKSSLINALRSNHPLINVSSEENNWFDSVVLRMHHFQILGSKLLEEQRVGEVSVRSGRGKHTTRHVSLLPLSGGGYLADTPGFNQPSLLKVTTQSLAKTFPEIRKLLSANEPEKCSFNDCLHLGEPGYKTGDMGVKQAEPRLEPKKHRRQSRKRMNQSILDELDDLDDDDSLLDAEEVTSTWLKVEFQVFSAAVNVNV